jgi:glycosyltransferase involved in cell wall biosynthesis
LPSPLHIVLLDYRDVTHPEAGGAETYLQEIFGRIAAHGHRVTLICAGYQGAAPEDRIGRIRVLRQGNKLNANFVGARAAVVLSRKEHVDLFVENLCKIPFLMPLFTKIPVLPVVLHLFGHTVFQETNPVVASYVWLFEKLIPPFYRDVPFVALSESTAKDLVRRGVRASTIEIVRPGLELKRYAAGEAVLRSDRPLLLYVGRLKRYKGIDTVIRGFKLVLEANPSALLVLVGKGDDRPRLQALARSLGLGDAVRFEGYVPEETKIRWLRQAHALVYPSPREGWGIAAGEAAACGTPVLASDAEGLRDAVRDGESGFLIPHRDTRAWAARMIEILGDAPLRERMGAAGRAWAQQLDWDVESEKMRRIVGALASGPAR